MINEELKGENAEEISITVRNQQQITNECLAVSRFEEFDFFGEDDACIVDAGGRAPLLCRGRIAIAINDRRPGEKYRSVVGDSGAAR